jgi:hypothetical protein
LGKKPFDPLAVEKRIPHFSTFLVRRRDIHPETGCIIMGSREDGLDLGCGAVYYGFPDKHNEGSVYLSGRSRPSKYNLPEIHDLTSSFVDAGAHFAVRRLYHPRQEVL